MTFRGYVRHRRITDDSAGDFVAVARLDIAMPDAETWDELRRYLERQMAGEVVMEAARRVWRGYLTARARETASAREPRERRPSASEPSLHRP